MDEHPTQRAPSTSSLTALSKKPTAAENQSVDLAIRILQSRLEEAGFEKAFSQRLRQMLDRCIETRLDLLPLLTCEAAGGRPRQAIPLTAAWQWLRLSAKLLDDVGDGESPYPPAEAVHLAAGLLFLAPLGLGELAKGGMPARSIETLAAGMHEAGLRACAGQYGELACLDELDPDSWLEVARAKSGAPCAWASWAGALAASPDEETLDAFREFGMHLGVLLQIADDFNDVWRSTGLSDLRADRLNLAMCYARLVAGGEQRDRLKTSLQNASQGDGAAEAHIRRELVELGAQAYLLAAGRLQYQQAMAALSRSGCLTPSLVALLDEIWPALQLPASEANPHDTPI